MTDDRLDALLSRLERPARPDPAFGDELFERLLVEAGLRGRTRTGLTDVWRWFGSDRATTARLAWLAVLAALLVVFGAIIAGPGGRPLLSIVPLPTQSPTASPSDATPPSSPSDAPTAPPIESSVMGIGDPAPAWSGRLLDGRDFSTATLEGKPAALFLWCLCINGPQARAFLEAGPSRSSEVSLVFVSMDGEGTTRGLADWLDVETPIVHDPEMDLLSQWGIDGWPALILLRADGTLAAIQTATFDEAKLGGLLDALAAGAPIPDPDPPQPVPTDAEGNLPLTTVLEVGQVPPSLVGPALGGGELSTSDLVGRPTAVAFWHPPRADGSPQDDSLLPEALIADVERRAGAIDLLLVAEGEPEPGDAERYLERLGADVPVIFDWSAELRERWGLVFSPTLVLFDAEGRVVDVVGAEGLTDPAAALDRIDP